MDISIVIASGAGGEFLVNCLDSLNTQASNPDIEVIVVDRFGDNHASQIKEKYTFVNVITPELDHPPSVPELRKIGVENAKGDIVAIIEEHCLAPSNWVDSIKMSFHNIDAAIGGPIIDDNYLRLTDWAVYFSEYHNYLPPWEKGNRYGLNGANIAYNRDYLLKHLEALSLGFWEVVLHPSLVEDGNFRAVPEMGVKHTGPFGYLYYLRQRYLLSRVWGGTQREIVSTSKRILYLVLAPILPIFILYRISRRVTLHKRLRSKFLLVLPQMIPIVLAYVIGEWSGYLIGVGRSLEHVE